MEIVESKKRLSIEDDVLGLEIPKHILTPRSQGYCKRGFGYIDLHPCW
jgi:hypothetical protein